MSGPRVRPLLHALLARELGGRLWFLRVLLLVGGGGIAGVTAARYRLAHAPGDPPIPGSGALLEFQLSALLCLGAFAAVRVMLRFDADRQALWQPQYFAAGMERELFAVLLPVCVAGTGFIDYVALLLGFGSAHQLLAHSSPGWPHLLSLLPVAPLWLGSVCAFAALCLLLVMRPGAGLLLFGGWLLLPFLLAVLTYSEETDLIPRGVRALFLASPPTMLLRASPRLLFFLLGYTAIAHALALPLAGRRLGRHA